MATTNQRGVAPAECTVTTAPPAALNKKRFDTATPGALPAGRAWMARSHTMRCAGWLSDGCGGWLRIATMAACA